MNECLIFKNKFILCSFTSLYSSGISSFRILAIVLVSAVLWHFMIGLILWCLPVHEVRCFRFIHHDISDDPWWVVWNFFLHHGKEEEEGSSVNFSMSSVQCVELQSSYKSYPLRDQIVLSVQIKQQFHRQPYWYLWFKVDWNFIQISDKQF